MPDRAIVAAIGGSVRPTRDRLATEVVGCSPREPTVDHDRGRTPAHQAHDMGIDVALDKLEVGS